MAIGQVIVTITIILIEECEHGGDFYLTCSR